MLGKWCVLCAINMHINISQRKIKSTSNLFILVTARRRVMTRAKRWAGKERKNRGERERGRVEPSEEQLVQLDRYIQARVAQLYVQRL